MDGQTAGRTDGRMDGPTIGHYLLWTYEDIECTTHLRSIFKVKVFVKDVKEMGRPPRTFWHKHAIGSLLDKGRKRWIEGMNARKVLKEAITQM